MRETWGEKGEKNNVFLKSFTDLVFGGGNSTFKCNQENGQYTHQED